MDIVMRSLPDGPVARVNKVYLQKEEFALIYESELRRIINQTKNPNLPTGARIQIGLQCLSTLIEQEMLYQKADSHKISVSEDEVKKAAADQLDRLAKGLSQEGEPPLTQKDVLTRLGYTDVVQVENEMRRAMIIKAVRSKVISQSEKEIDEETVQKVYEQNKDQFSQPSGLHLKQIYIEAHTESKTVRAEARKKAEKALDVLYSGKSFEAVAKEFSDSPDAKVGGDLGLIPIPKLPPFFVSAVEKLGDGDISEVFETERGFHILQLIKRLSASNVDREKLEQAIRIRLQAEQESNNVRLYLDQLISEGAKIDVFIELQENVSRLSENSELPLE